MVKVNVSKVTKLIGIMGLAIVTLGILGCGSDEDKIRDAYAKIDKEIVPKASTMKAYSKERSDFFKQHCDLAETIIKLDKQYEPKNFDEMLNNPNAEKAKAIMKIEGQIEREYCDKYIKEDKSKKIPLTLFGKSEKCIIFDNFISTCKYE